MFQPRIPRSVGMIRRCRGGPASFSSGAAQSPPRPGGDGDAAAARPKQSFVQARIQPGEWDPDRTDPLYRPKYRSRAKILSLDDFANRPPVGFSGEFASLQDAMVTLSWLDHRQQAQIYQLYTELLRYAAAAHRRGTGLDGETGAAATTSHDYVTRVLAQKFNLTQERVAAVVRLQHNEQVYRRQGRRLLEETAAYADASIQQEIREAYQAVGAGSKPPEEFVEDPVGVTGELQDRKQWTVLEDPFDADKLLADAAVRDAAAARDAIDGHHYAEDRDTEAVALPLSKDAQGLLKQHQQLHATVAPLTADIPWPEPAKGARRDRWTFVAQVVNTRELKRRHAPHRSYVNNSPADTLVEHAGVLRAGTLADVHQVAWKPTRDVREHILADVQAAWLDHSRRGVPDVWGRAPEGVPPAPVPPSAAAEASAAEGPEGRAEGAESANPSQPVGGSSPTSENEPSAEGASDSADKK